MATEARFVPVIGSEGRQSITDYDGWKWSISTSGKRAVVFLGPPDANGKYTWVAARAAGKEVDLNRPITDYPDSPSGPQFREIYAYLVSLSQAGGKLASTATLPIVSGQSRSSSPTTRLI